MFGCLVLIGAVIGAVWYAADRIGAGAGGEKADPSELNVLLITLDSTRADFLGCYGRSPSRTPNLDRIAREGTRFAQCATPSSLTLPAHASIMTGLYPFVHGVRQNGDSRLAASSETLAEQLRSAGLSTHAVVACAVLNRRFGLAQGFDDYRDVISEDGALAGTERKASNVCDDAIKVLESAASGRFFLWVHFFDPHFPYVSSQLGHSLDAYENEINFMDAEIGRLLDELRRLKIDGKTLVVVVADHGEGLNQHHEFQHGNFVWQSTVSVPLLLRCPGTIPAGKHIDAQVRTIDIAPTILECVSAPAFTTSQGTSLTALLTGEAVDLELTAYAESLEPMRVYGFSPLRSLSNGHWKYILAPNPRLHNLADDPGEQHNRIAEKPDLAAEMRDQLRALIADAPAPPDRQEIAVELTAKDKAAFESLGYIDSKYGTDIAGRTELDLFEPEGRDPIELAERIKMHVVVGFTTRGGDYGTAEDVLRTIAADLPDVPRIQVDLARTLWKRGKLEQAKKLYEPLLDDPDTRATYGALLVDAKQWDEAVAQLTLVLQSQPNHIGAHYNLGVALGSLGRNPEAHEHFQRTLALSPEDAKMWHGMGVFYARQQMYDRAVEFFRKALEIDPSYTAAQDGLKQTEQRRQHQ